MIKIYLWRSLQKRWKKYILMLITMILSFTTIVYSGILAFGTLTNAQTQSELHYQHKDTASDRYFSVLGMNETQYQTLVQQSPTDNYFTTYSIAMYHSDTYANPEHLIAATAEIAPFFGLTSEELPSKNEVYLCDNYNHEYSYAPLGSYPDFSVLFSTDVHINSLKATKNLPHVMASLIHATTLQELVDTYHIPVYYSVFYPTSDSELAEQIYAIEVNPCFYADMSAAYSFYDATSVRGTSADEVTEMFMVKVRIILKFVLAFCFLVGGGTIFMNFRLLAREIKDDARILLSLGIPRNFLLLIGCLPSGILLLISFPIGIVLGHFFVTFVKKPFLAYFSNASFYLSGYTILFMLVLAVLLLVVGVFPTMYRIAHKLPLQLLADTNEQTEYEILESKSASRLYRHPSFWLACLHTIRRKWSLALPNLLQLISLCAIAFLLVMPNYYILSAEALPEEDFLVRLVSLKTDDGISPFLTEQDLQALTGVDTVVDRGDGTYLITSQKGQFENVRNEISQFPYQIEMVQDYTIKRTTINDYLNINRIIYVFNAVLFLVLEILQRFIVSEYHIWNNEKEYHILHQLGATSKSLRNMHCYEVIMQYGIIAGLAIIISPLAAYFILYRGLGESSLGIRYDLYGFTYEWHWLFIVLIVGFALALAARLCAYHKYLKTSK
ncbi:MAG: hypothetical protein IJY09_03060 [Lachnospiraceae bacterium]|nr:hypothetical protein [Lachnospiraceae bacterium]